MPGFHKSIFVVLSSVVLAAIAWTIICFQPRLDEHTSDHDPTPTSSTSGQDGAPLPELDFEEELLRIASEYEEWGPVDAEASWAPLLCRLPLPSDKHQVELRASDSDDHDTHGRKMYLLYAKDRAEYKLAPNEPSESGQVIVKQAWKPVEVVDEDFDEETLNEWKEELSALGFPHSHVVEIESESVELPISMFVYREGKMYRPAELHSLFIMFKTDESDERSDDGWVYGTVTADGERVTSVGQVEQCMNCHVDAGVDRLFGLPERFNLRPRSDD